MEKVIAYWYRHRGEESGSVTFWIPQGNSIIIIDVGPGGSIDGCIDNHFQGDLNAGFLNKITLSQSQVDRIKALIKFQSTFAKSLRTLTKKVK